MKRARRSSSRRAGIRSADPATRELGATVRRGEGSGSPTTEPAALRRARSLCIVSGKGGTGKSSVSASLAALFARQGNTLLLDADLGCANAHILQDVHPKHSFADVITGNVDVADIVTRCPNGVDLLAGGSGFARLAGLKSFELEMIGRGLVELEPAYEHLVIDSAAGLSRQTVAFAAASDMSIIVTTPDVTAMTDAYAFLKVFARQCEALGIKRPMPLLVVNRTTDPAEAESVAHRLQEVVSKFLRRRIELLGWLPEDRAAFRCIQRRTTIVDGEPDSDIARSIVSLSNGVRTRLAELEALGVGQRLSACAHRERNL